MFKSKTIFIMPYYRPFNSLLSQRMGNQFVYDRYIIKYRYFDLTYKNKINISRFIRDSKTYVLVNDSVRFGTRKLKYIFRRRNRLVLYVCIYLLSVVQLS